jgi:leucyl-tRNA synthetase
MTKYNPEKIEKKWQKYWETKKLYVAKDKIKDKENFYFLVEFPYPSGNLHVGHWDRYAVTDILARYLRMKGKNITYPIGFDAFGLPAENAAIKNNLQPADWTKKNVAYMTKQLKSIGASFDWSREVKTTDPAYYKWTQWIFLQLYKKGLAYRAKTLVNWCPKDKTVLANEQVVDGKCDRCGTEVVQKELSQWMFKITDYADRLIDDLVKVDWPEVAKTAQINWIGRSRGAEIHFLLPNSKETIKVFTTRADTLFGATYVVLAPEHPLVEKLTTDDKLDSVNKYLVEVRKKSELERISLEKEKTGVFSGAYAVNPVNNEKIPVWIADYVLGQYGTGAVMAVPAHDERDFEFAKKYK